MITAAGSGISLPAAVVILLPDKKHRLALTAKLCPAWRRCAARARGKVAGDMEKRTIISALSLQNRRQLGAQWGIKTEKLPQFVQKCTARLDEMRKKMYYA